MRVDGDLEFHRWYYDKYHDVQSIVPLEVYGEYLDYKEKKRDENLVLLLILLYILIIILSNKLILKIILGM